MGTPETYLRPAGEALVRAHAAELKEVGLRHGARRLRYASAGRLLGAVDDDRDALDMAQFAVEAEDLLGAEVSLLSEGVLGHPNVSLDLLEAQPI